MARIHIGTAQGKRFFYELNTLNQHGAVIGASGSGKTVMCKVLVEEALMRGIPVIAIDPKGDIPGLGIVDDGFDFRPFVGTRKKAEKIAGDYLSRIRAQQIEKEGVSRLKDIRINIFTPKSSVGKQLSLIPDLSAPKDFSRLAEEDPAMIADFVEPVSSSIVKLAGISGAVQEKVRSLISQILIHSWKKQEDLTIEELIGQVIEPPFDRVGTLPLDDFISQKEKKKAAAGINLILSSPSKKAWSIGDKLDIEELFSRDTLSVFDLRFCPTAADKQHVAEEIMQKIYKFLLGAGGSSRLRYMLYFDELSGFLPPAPANPPSKRLLELLIRQSRAFGLGILVATQNPGDIDYKVFGNIGTRFIGKLRTDNDIEKVAAGTGLMVSDLRQKISSRKTGEFFLNDSVVNKNTIICSRWLLSYHGGPLKDHEIAWLNDPDKIQKPDDSLDPRIRVIKKKQEKTKPHNKSSGEDSRIEVINLGAGSKKKRKKIDDPIRSLCSAIRKHSDRFYLRCALSEASGFRPYLKVVVEPKEFRKIKFDMAGPYFFDLTREMVPEYRPLRKYSFSQFQKKEMVIDRPKRGTIRKAVEYATSDARGSLKTEVYESTLTSFSSVNQDKVERFNSDYLKKFLEPKIAQLDRSEKSYKKTRKGWVNRNSRTISHLHMRIRAVQARHMIRKVIGKDSNLLQSRQITQWKARIGRLAKENSILIKDIMRFMRYTKERKAFYIRKAQEKAARSVRKISYNPSRKDLVVHSYLMLVPKEETMSDLE
jgi:hypothetical protein